MMKLPELLSIGIEKNIRRPIWVSDLVFMEESNKWKLKNYENDLGDYDVVIIAHNGKCAERLIKSVPSAKSIHDRLMVSFGPTLPKPNKMTKMQLCSLWVGTFVVKKGLVNNFGDAIIVDDNKSILSWICCTSRKIGQFDDKLYESYTIISTREYAANNKVPQENVPSDKEKQVK